MLDVRSFFNLSERDARTILGEVADALGEWRRVATDVGIDRREQDQVSVALSGLDSAAAIRHRDGPVFPPAHQTRV